VLGYSEHEWINRMRWDAATLGAYQILQPVHGVAPTWLEAPPAPTPLPKAVADLLGQVPEGSDEVAIARLLPSLPLLADGLAELEATARREIDAYVAACAAALKGAPADATAALERVPMPFLVQSLNRAGRDGAVYCVLAGDLRYPRPAVAPLLQRLVAEAAHASDDVGGALATSRVTAGREEISLMLDTRGAARFLTTAIDAVFRDWLATPERMQALQAAVAVPGDGRPAAGEVLLVNPLWVHD
jgi:hypothetical protein